MLSLIQELKREEGFRSKLYYCTEGKPTIGYGFNLEAGITKEEATSLLEIRLTNYRTKIEKRFPKLHQLNTRRQSVLLNMAYNMGVGGLFNFKKMFIALEQDDFIEAARQIMDSKAARQLPTRYKRLAKKMST